ncbi:MAG: tail fiber domain-containing protein [Pseudomonadota bacterium]|nr:tail fiber domain-containing protein [Pseudomonadota bacterium]
MATYVNDLRLKEIGTGESSGTWGTETNTNLELIGEALGFGTEAITTNADTHTTTVADGSTDPGRAMYLKYTGTLDSACTITIAPNTISRMHFIENATSGSQNIIISQGSGANVTIPAGDVKAVYLDGAGSGAAVTDAFASLNVVDLKVEDDLTVTDDLIVNGDIDLEGSIDVNGTANLDVVDIDGAVDMASTLAVGGATTVTQSSAATAATFKVSDNSAQVANVVVSNDADTGLNLGVFGSSAGTAGMISASDAFITTSTTELNVGVNNSSGVLKFGVGNGSGTASERLRIHSNGSIGVNQSSPSSTYVLDVGGSVRSTGNSPSFNLREDDSSSQHWQLGSYSGVYALRNVTAGTFPFQVNTTGIGFNTAASKSLHILSADPVIRLEDSSPSAYAEIDGAGGDLIISCDAGDNDANSVIKFKVDNSEKAVLDSSGQLGLGETAPDVRLHVNSGTENIVSKFESSDTEARVQFKDSTGTTFIACRNDIRFGNDTSTERMRVNVNGHVLIGTTTNQGVGGISFQKASTGVNIQQNMDGTSGGAELYVFRRNSTQIGSINQSSTNAVTYNTSSDARLKDVTGSSRGLDVINNLNPVAYNWKSDNHADEGLIAQEVEELVPNAVSQDEDGYYSMDYSKLVTHLVKGMQEQQEQIESLKSEILSLKEK